MPFITTNNNRFYYELHGKGDPLVLISGLSANHHLWDAVVPLLAKHYQVLIFDNRGCGQSDTPDMPYSMELFADDVMALCQALDIQHPHVVGNSMGGMIVQTLGHKYPQQVRSLTIVNSALKNAVPFNITADVRLALWQRGMEQNLQMKMLLPWAFSDAFLQQPGKIDELLKLFTDDPYPQSLTGFQRQLAALREFDASEWIADVDLPTLVVTGEQDFLLTPASSQAIAERINGARYVCFEKTGHIPMIEQPEKFSETLLAFLLTVKQEQQQAGAVVS